MVERCLYSTLRTQRGEKNHARPKGQGPAEKRAANTCKTLQLYKLRQMCWWRDAQTDLALTANYLRPTGDVCLVAEVPYAGKHHSQAQPVRRLNYLGVALRASGLYHGCGPGFRDFFDAIREREESVGSHHRSLQR